MFSFSPSSSLRAFRLVCTPEQVPTVEAMLRAQGYVFEPDPFFAPARRLTVEPRPLGSSLAAFFGLIYIQDRASMLPPLALEPAPGAVVLDMCASPGSKTGQLAYMVGPQGLVLGNEPSPSRLATLRRNLHTMNLTWAVTCCRSGEALSLPDASMDHILLDPPCSGWGTVERHPKVRDIWKEDKVQPLIRLQRALLAEACRLLAPGGVLVYSTCTTNVEENEAQVCHAVEELGLIPEALPALPGFTLDSPLSLPGGKTVDGVWRLSPRTGESQGFFVARLRKPGLPLASVASGSEGDCLRFTAVPESRLAEQGIEPAHLPGPVGMFGDSLHVIPRLALQRLPGSLRWQGMYAGKAGRGGEIRLSPRLRLPAPAHCSLSVVDLEGRDGLTLIESLLAGRSAEWQDFPDKAQKGEGRDVFLRWQGLLLGRVRRKGRRLIWSER